MKAEFLPKVGKFLLDYMRLYYSPEESIFLLGISYPPPISLTERHAGYTKKKIPATAHVYPSGMVFIRVSYCALCKDICDPSV